MSTPASFDMLPHGVLSRVLNHLTPEGALPYVLLTLPLVVGSVLAMVVAVSAWRRRSVPGAKPFALTLVVVSLWSAAEVAEILVDGFEASVFWDRLQYLAGVTPVLWMYLGAVFSRRAGWFVRWGWMLFTAFAAVTAGIVISGDPGGLVWTKVWLDETEAVPVLHVIHGPWFWLNIVVVYALFVAGGLLMILKSSRERLGSLALTVLGVAFGLIGGAINALDLAPSGVADATIYGVTFGSILVAFGHFRFNILDSLLGVLPVALETVVEQLDDPVVVVSPDSRYTYANAAARRLFDLGDGVLTNVAVGEPLAGVLARHLDSEAASLEIGHHDGASPGQYELRITPLTRGKVAVGRLFVFHDITERMERERHLEHMAGHDPLTGLANWRSFETAMEQARRRAESGDQFALLYMDADGFKTVNDTLGHAAGDEVLTQLAKRLAGQLRGADLLARVGGDEFAVLLSGVSGQRAVPVADRIRRSVCDRPFSVSGIDCPISLSIGLGGLVGHTTVESAVHAADAAMYVAKRRGSNQVALADEPESLDRHLPTDALAEAG